MTHGPIDLCRGEQRVITTYLVETEDGLGLVDCGPSSCLPALEAALTARGVSFGDLRHLLLTHVHLDHAGAAGGLVRANPALRVHVSEVGAPHVVDPSRLEASSRRLYGNRFDFLWGELAAVPAANVEPAGDRVVDLDCFPSRGHANHHVSYLHPDGTLYSGDSAGMRVAPARFVLPITPPPEVDLDAWERTIAETERRRPARLALPHFGVFDDVDEHLAGFRATLRRWAERVRDDMDESEFVAAASADVAASDPEEAAVYDRSDPYWACYQGLERYWRKRREAE